LFYVDESFDSEKFCLSAIGIPHTEWRECFARVREHRQLLKQDFGILIRKEIHASEFVNGRGRVSDQTLGKHERSRIFKGLLRLVAQLPNVMIINVCLKNNEHSDVQLVAWDRLMNRIERTMLEFEKREIPLRRSLVAELASNVADGTKRQIERRLVRYRPVASVLADQGREREITRALRKMGVYNPIPSKLGDWGDGQKAKNIPLQRVIEDPVFKLSHQSYFIQLADAVAYALLKREVPATKNIRRYGIDKMFDTELAGVCYKKASAADPLGIVRK
jgi:hypothetical protein